MVNFLDVMEEEDNILVEVNEGFKEHIIEGDCGETLSLMVHKLLYNMSMKEEHPQRHSIFCTRGMQPYY